MRPRLLYALGLCAALLLAGAPATAQVTFTVNDPGDAGDGSCDDTCTLRDAITEANAAAGLDSVVFAPVITTVTVQTTPIEVSENVVVTGAGVTIMGDGTNAIFSLSAIAALGDLDLSDGDVVTTTPTPDGGVLELGQSGGNQTEFAGVLSGPGGFTKSGTGDVTLSGANTYTGSTVITGGGRLQVTTESLPDATATAFAGLDAGTLAFVQNASGEHMGSIDGNGRVEVEAPGQTVTLSGSNGYTGGTTIVGTTTLVVDVGTAGSLGPGEVCLGSLASDGSCDGSAGGGTLEIDQDVDGSFGENITGAGSVRVVLAGGVDLTLGGDNDFVDPNSPNPMLPDPGTLTLESESTDGQLSSLLVDTDSLLGDAVNNGNVNRDAIIFVQDGNEQSDVYAGTFSGTGSGVKTGTGNLTLEGEISNDIFTVIDGPFTLTDQSVIDTGTAFRIDDLGLLLGTSSNPDNLMGTLAVAGAIDPGGPLQIGVLDTDFDVEFLTTDGMGTLFVDVEMGSADLLRANTVDAEPGTLIDVVLIDPDSTLAPGTPILTDQAVIQTTGGVTGSFVGNSSSFFFDVSTPTIQGNDVLISVVRNSSSFSDAAQTPNQMSVAGTLDGVSGSVDPGLQAVIDALGAESEAGIESGLDALSGEGLSAFTTPRLASKRRLDRVIEMRVRDFAARYPSVYPQQETPRGRGALFGPFVGPGPLRSFEPAEDARGAGGWIDGFGDFGEVQGRDGSATVDYRVYGTTLGWDYRLSPHVMMGLGGGYTRIETDLRGRSEWGSANVGQFALYGGGAWRGFHALVQGRFAYGGFDSERRIAFGSIDETARGHFGGLEASARTEIGMTLFELGGLRFQPFSSFDYAFVQQDGFSETDAASALRVEGQSWNSTLLGVGARIHGLIRTDEEWYMLPQLHARYTREFGDIARIVSPTLTGTGTPGVPYDPIAGASLARDGLLAGAGWTMGNRDGLRLFADYEVGWNSRLIEHTIKAGLLLVF